MELVPMWSKYWLIDTSGTEHWVFIGCLGEKFTCLCVADFSKMTLPIIHTFHVYPLENFKTLRIFAISAYLEGISVQIKRLSFIKKNPLLNIPNRSRVVNYIDRNNNTWYNTTVIPNDSAALAIHISHNNKVIFPYQNMQGLNNKTHQIYVYYQNNW